LSELDKSDNKLSFRIYSDCSFQMLHNGLAMISAWNHPQDYSAEKSV